MDTHTPAFELKKKKRNLRTAIIIKPVFSGLVLEIRSVHFTVFLQGSGAAWLAGGVPEPVRASVSLGGSQPVQTVRCPILRQSERQRSSLSPWSARNSVNWVFFQPDLKMLTKADMCGGGFGADYFKFEGPQCVFRVEGLSIALSMNQRELFSWATQESRLDWGCWIA